MSKPSGLICPYCGEAAVSVPPGHRCRHERINDYVYCTFRDRICNACGKSWETCERPTQAYMQDFSIDRKTA